MKTRLSVAVLLGLCASGVAQAALYDRGGGLIYDSVLNVTWLQNANYAASELTDARVAEIVANVNGASPRPSWLGSHVMTASDFGTSGTSYTGRMTWWGAMAWADQLVHAGLDDWRLPVMVFPGDGAYVFSNNGTTTGGFGATGSGWGPAGDGDGLWSEFGWMYYHNLGNLGYCTPDNANPSSCITQTGWGLSNTGPFSNLQSSTYWSGTEYAPDPGSAWVFFHATYGGYQQDGVKDINHPYAWAVRPGDVPLPGAGLLLASALVGLGRARRRAAS